jgi:NAD(P)-dependent dehydrogenase (short-subunit alcohol dehydrogenase family)/acyl dehydratase
VTRTLRLSQEHLQRFAEASGDRNPLHVEEAFARRTPYGRCIAHGALVTAAALGSADATALANLRSVDARFKQPVFPGEDYAVSVVQADARKTRVEVAAAGQVAVTVTVSAAADASEPQLPPAARQEAPAHAASPRRHTLEELAGADASFSERYACDLEALSRLAAELGAADVPDAILVWLAAASYTVGMLVPGRDALLVGARIARASRPDVGALDASVKTVDDRTGLVIVDAALTQGGASARMTLQAFIRSPVPPPDRSSIGRHLPPSAELSGRRALVVGGSRGLGAALCGALATQGATVWVGFARSTAEVAALRAEFGDELLRPLQFDATDPDQARQAFAALADEAGELDGVVLCAAPPLQMTRVHPDASAGTLAFIRSSLAMALVPLAESVQLLRPDGWLVIVSSAALDDPPEGWPHYVTAKAALEGAAAYCARHTQARVLVVRAPRMWTDATNTELGRIGAVPKEQVASAIVAWTASGKGAREPTVLTPDELLGESAGNLGQPT